MNPKSQKENKVAHTVSERGSRLEYKAPSNGIFSVLPKSWKPYAELMRLDRPAGFFAFYWHYLVGLGYGAAICKPMPSPVAVSLVAVYLAALVVVHRGAVCTINDNLDQEFDRRVARTQSRPIARGAVSTTEAYIFALIQYVILTSMILWHPFPPGHDAASIYTSLPTVILTVYPLAKRVTDFPQIVLGFGFAAEIPFSAVMIGLDLQSSEHAFGPLLSLCVASAIWAIIFDTIYAHQDLKDDVKTGVGSLAVRLGQRSKPALLVLAIAQVALLVTAGVQSAFSPLYFVISCGGAGLALLIMLVRVDLKTPASCAWWFGEGTALVGVSLVTGLLGEYAARKWVT